ncbi:oxygen tolerance family protein, partial [Vibrio parahaemolyticus V-223/04]
KHLVIL